LRTVPFSVGQLLIAFLLAAPLMALDPHTKITDLVHTAWSGGELPFSAVTDLAQTTDGNLWVSADEGLFRFDGVRFVRFEPFSGTHLRYILATHDGSLWVVFSSGLVSRLSGGRITRFSLQELPQTNQLAEDRDGSIIAATAHGGLARFRHGHWHEAASALHHSARLSRQVWFDRDGVLWLLTEDRLLKLLPGEDHFIDPGIPARPSLLSRHPLAESPDGAVWFADSGLVRPVKPGGSENEVKVGANTVMVDRQGSLWVGSKDDGLWRFSGAGAIASGLTGPTGPELEQFTKRDGLSGNIVECAIEDREGNVWVGTDQGLDRFRNGVFHQVAIPDADRINGLYTSSDGGVILALGDRSYLERVDPEGKITLLRFAGSAIANCEDSDGAVWVSTSAGFGRLTSTGISYPPQPRLTAITRMSCRFGDVWITDERQGVVRFSAGKVTSVPGLRSQVRRFFPESPGRVWATYTDGRISIYDSGAIREYGMKDGLPGGAIFDIVKADGGDIWLAGENGLLRFRNGRFQHADVAPGLRLSNIERDDSTFLWLRAGRVLMRMDTREFDRTAANPGYRPRLESYGPQEGIPGDVRIMARSGKRVWVSTSKSLGYVDLNPHIPKNPWPPPVQIEALTVDGKTVNASGGMALPKLIHNLQIDYTALSLSIPERVRFRYKLEGVDKDWQESGTRRQAYYNDPPPKKYRFLVKACNNDGVWNETGAMLDFSIDPAYYQTHWFEAAWGAVGLAVLWGLYRYRLYRLAQKFNVRFEERVNERARIARELHDTLLQSFQALMLRLQAVDDMLPEGKAKDRLEQTLQRGDQAIADGRSAVYDLRSSATTTNDLAVAVSGLGDELATEDSAAFRLVVEGIARDLHAIIRDELYGISREALRNAFSHASARSIETEITYGERELQLRIRDDGEGIPLEILEQGRSGHYGLPGMRERARQIGGQLDIRSQCGAGTEIKLTIAATIAYRRSKGRRLFRLFQKREDSV
jgi:ligand-binding sensor domain-containing protein/anti-sigma regulatory factor (Ser/Thr protein kinase)